MGRGMYSFLFSGLTPEETEEPSVGIDTHTSEHAVGRFPIRLSHEGKLCKYVVLSKLSKALSRFMSLLVSVAKPFRLYHLAGPHSVCQSPPQCVQRS